MAAFRINYQVSISLVPEGSAGLALVLGGNSSVSPAIGPAIVQFFTPPAGVVIPFNGTLGSSPTAADITTGLNNMLTAIQAQITPAVVTRVQNFAQGGS